MTTVDSSLFDFKVPDSNYKYKINEDLFINIRRSNDGVALLYFTNQHNHKLDIPDEIQIHALPSPNGPTLELVPKADIKHYALCYTESYVVQYNYTVVLNIASQRQWKIVGINA